MARDAKRSLSGVLGLALSITCAIAQEAPPPRPAGQLLQRPELRVEGMTLYEPAHIHAFAKTHTAQTQGISTAADVAETIALMYREDGYFLAQARISAPTSRDPARLIVSEGNLQRIEVIGVNEALGDRIGAIVKSALGSGPIRQSEFERALMLAGDLAGVRVRAEFVPAADGSGEMVLKLHASQGKGRGSISLDTPPGAFGKVGTATLMQEFYSTLTPGDMIRLVGGINANFRDNTGLNGGVYYRAPINALGTYVEGYVGNSHFRRDAAGALVNT